MDKTEINRELARILPPPPHVSIFFVLDTYLLWEQVELMDPITVLSAVEQVAVHLRTEH